MKEKQFIFNKSTLTIRFGNILESDAEVIVSSDDNMLSMRGGVSMAILHQAGQAIRQDAMKKVPAQLGDVIVTTAGQMPQKFVFHTITRNYEKGGWADDKEHQSILKKSIKKTFQLLELLDCHSIAMPAIGTGAARIPLVTAATEMAENISGILLQTDHAFTVCLYLMDQNNQMTEFDYIEFFTEFARCSAKTFKDNAIENTPNQGELPSSVYKQLQDAVVFISYSRRDCIDEQGNLIKDNVVTRILQTLKAHHISYWIDADGIFSGDAFASVLAEKIEQCKVFLFIASENSNASKWVSREVVMADETEKPIIPLRIDNSKYNPQVIMRLIALDYIDYAQNEELAMNKMVSAIQQYIGNR